MLVERVLLKVGHLRMLGNRIFLWMWGGESKQNICFIFQKEPYRRTPSRETTAQLP